MIIAWGGCSLKLKADGTQVADNEGSWGLKAQSPMPKEVRRKEEIS